MSETESSTSINTNPFIRCFNGLDRLFKHNQTLAIVLLIFSLAGSVFQFFNYSVPGSSEESSQLPALSDDFQVGLFLSLILPIIILVLALTVALSTYYNGLVNFVAWKTSKGESTTLTEALRTVTKRFWTLLAIQVLVFFKVLGGFLLFIIPGVRAALRYQMVFFPVFDEGLNASNAMRRIKSLTKHHLIEVFGIVTVATIIPVVGLLLSMGGEAVLYPELKAIESGAESPKVHWLNYLGFILVLVFLILGAGITAALVLALRS